MLAIREARDWALLARATAEGASLTMASGDDRRSPAETPTAAPAGPPADLDDGEVGLTVPADAAAIPHVVGGALQIFGGVAESVDRDEAAAFCDNLTVPWEGAELSEWRLPTLQEVQDNAQLFRGPGPFWIVDGAATQYEVGSERRPKPDAPWRTEDAEPVEPLAARCVRPAGA